MRKYLAFLLFQLFVCSGIGYCQTPQFAWASKIGGSGFDAPQTMTIDSNDCVIQIGSFEGTMDADPGPGVCMLVTHGYTDVFVRKLSSNGSFLWAYNFGNYYDEGPLCVKTDANGNIYILAYFQGIVDLDPGAGIFNVSTNLSLACWFLKLSPNGEFISAFCTDAVPSRFVLGSDNSIWLCGVFEGTVDFDPGPGIHLVTCHEATNGFVQKLSPDFQLDWVDEFRFLTTNGSPSLLALDNAGNIYVTGTFSGNMDVDPGPDTLIITSIGPRDVYFQKIDPQGNMLWTKNIGGTGECMNPIIQLTHDGSIVLSGYFMGTMDADPGPTVSNLASNGYYDIFVVKLTASGVLLWSRSMGNSQGDFAYGLAIDNGNNIYLTGSFWQTIDIDPGPAVHNLVSNGGKDIFILKLDPAGNYSWALNFGGTSTDQGTSIIVNKYGAVFCMGEFWNTVDFDPGPNNATLTSAGNSDVFLVKLFGGPDYSGTISGVVSYKNSSFSALDSTTVIIKKHGVLIAQTQTNDLGAFTFTGISPDSLTIECSTEKVCGGYNSLDAMLALQCFVGTNILTGVNHAAANVDMTPVVNSMDALFIVKRFVGMISVFPLSNWVFEKPVIWLNAGSTVNCQIAALCRGDINGSFTPY